MTIKFLIIDYTIYVLVFQCLFHSQKTIRIKIDVQ